MSIITLDRIHFGSQQSPRKTRSKTTFLMSPFRTSERSALTLKSSPGRPRQSTVATTTNRPPYELNTEKIKINQRFDLEAFKYIDLLRAHLAMIQTLIRDEDGIGMFEFKKISDINHMNMFGVLPRTYVEKYVAAWNQPEKWVYTQSPGTCVMSALLNAYARHLSRLPKDEAETLQNHPGNSYLEKQRELMSPGWKTEDIMTVIVAKDHMKDIEKAQKDFLKSYNRERTNVDKEKANDEDNMNIILAPFVLWPPDRYFILSWQYGDASFPRVHKKIVDRSRKGKGIPYIFNDLKKEFKNYNQQEAAAENKEAPELAEYLDHLMDIKAIGIACLLLANKKASPDDSPHAITIDVTCEGIDFYDSWDGTTWTWSKGEPQSDDTPAPGEPREEKKIREWKGLLDPSECLRDSSKSAVVVLVHVGLLPMDPSKDQRV